MKISMKLLFLALCIQAAFVGLSHGAASSGTAAEDVAREESRLAELSELFYPEGPTAAELGKAQAEARQKEGLSAQILSYLNAVKYRVDKAIDDQLWSHLSRLKDLGEVIKSAQEGVSNLAGLKNTRLYVAASLALQDFVVDPYNYELLAPYENEANNIRVREAPFDKLVKLKRFIDIGIDDMIKGVSGTGFPSYEYFIFHRP